MPQTGKSRGREQREQVAVTATHAIEASVAPAKLARTWADGYGLLATRSLQTLIVIALAALVVTAGIALKTLVIAVLLAIILACAFNPLVRLIGKIVPRTLAAALTLLIAIGILGGLLTLVGFAVAGQAGKISEAVTKSVGQVETYLQHLGVPVDDNSIHKVVLAVQHYVTSASFGSSALVGLSAAGEIATGTVLLLFVLFFLLRDGQRIWQFLIQVLKGENHARAERIGAAGAITLGRYARGTATIAAIDAIIIGIVLAICHVPLALPLAVLVFVTAFIPIIGAPLAGALAAGVGLVFNGPVIAIVIIAALVGVHILEAYVFHPLIMGHAVSLHPLALLLALTAGTILGGVVGAVLAVPTASFVWSAIKAWKNDKSESF